MVVNRCLDLLHHCCHPKQLHQAHAHLLISGLLSLPHLLNALIRTCARLGLAQHAERALSHDPNPNAFLWTSAIHAQVCSNLPKHAFVLFQSMLAHQARPLEFTLSSLLKASALNLDPRSCLSLHTHVEKLGFESWILLQNGLVDAYAKCGRLDLAREVFDEMDERDLVSWNSIIAGYSGQGEVGIARKLFEEMPERNSISWTSIIGGYLRVGDLVEARTLFDRMGERDPASWRVMIEGYLAYGEIVAAQYLFELMPQKDIGSWNLMIRGLCQFGEMCRARVLFDQMPKKNVASWTMMVDGFMKIGDLGSAVLFFEQMPEKNLISWTVMISGFAHNGAPIQALDLFWRFEQMGIEPDETCILGAISACSQLGILETGEKIIQKHINQIAKTELSPQMVTSMIDMYAKCGAVDKAYRIFKEARDKDVVCYSAMITAFANHGKGEEALGLFYRMLENGFRPDGVTFMGVLSACSHSALIEEGKKQFESMSKDYGIRPSERHYACMVDLLGRAGCLREVLELIETMPFEPGSSIWGAMLAACRVHCNVELAEVAAKHLFKIEPDNSGNYVLLSNVYAAKNQWENVSKLRAMRRERGVRKNRGCSWIEVNSCVHEFIMEDRRHPDSNSIYEVLEGLLGEMMLIGHGIDDLI